MEASYRKPLRFRLLYAYWIAARILVGYVALKATLWRSLPEERAARLAAAQRHWALIIRDALFRLQGLFIKVGQTVSVLAAALPDALRQPLETLQDRLPPRPWAEVKRSLSEAFGPESESLFAHIDQNALASASLGQVHRATLHDGTAVVIKVRHHDIVRTARQDLRALRSLLRLVERLFAVRGVMTVYTQVARMVEAELDFRQEAKALTRLADILAYQDKVTLPVCHSALCRESVVVMSYVEGTKINDIETLKQQGLDPSTLAADLIEVFAHMVFDAGFYHADPHPGNILVDRTGRIVLLDLGATGSVSTRMRRGMSEFVTAILRQERRGLIDAMRTMGFIPKEHAAAALTTRLIERFYERMSDVIEIESFKLDDLRIKPERALEEFAALWQEEISVRKLAAAFEIPPDWVLLERTLVILAHVCAELAPELNPATLIQEHVESHLFQGRQDIASLLLHALRTKALSALDLPEEIRHFISDLRGDAFCLGVRLSPELGLLHYWQRERQQLGVVLALCGAAAPAAEHFQLRLPAAVIALAGVACIRPFWRASKRVSALLKTLEHPDA